MPWATTAPSKMGRIFRMMKGENDARRIRPEPTTRAPRV
jgi:hypothetical protein